MIRDIREASLSYIKVWTFIFLFSFLQVHVFAQEMRSNSTLHEKKTILISSFDAFSGQKSNNSQVMARWLKNELESSNQYEVYLCPLETKYVLSSLQLIECINQLPHPPQLILSLGEYILTKRRKCPDEIKVETTAVNLNHDWGPDNAGVSYKNQEIIKGAKSQLMMPSNLKDAYCSLRPSFKKQIFLSDDAGTFVCNDLMYRMRYEYPNLNFHFIHVASHKCKKDIRILRNTFKTLFTLTLELIKKSNLSQDFLTSPLLCE